VTISLIGVTAGVTLTIDDDGDCRAASCETTIAASAAARSAPPGAAGTITSGSHDCERGAG
jgi:hypothetical protein